jgi:hypothetical protein
LVLAIPQVQQGQSGTYTAYSTPIEYLITPESGDCLYTDPPWSASVLSAEACMGQVLARYSPRLGPIRFTKKTQPLDTSLLGASGRVLSTLITNSKEADDAVTGFKRGLTTTYAESIHRPYYRAVLVPAKMRAESFTAEFQAAVRQLADAAIYLKSVGGSASVGPIMDAAETFIADWGNFMLDSAVLVSERTGRASCSAYVRIRSERLLTP